MALQQKFELKEDMITGYYGGSWPGDVYIGKSLVSLKKSLELDDHSREGFAWGYGGSSPLQLSLGILIEFTDAQQAHHYSRKFTDEVIANLPDREDFQLPIKEVVAWLEKNGVKNLKRR